MPVAAYQAVGSLRKNRSKVRRTVAASARIDLAARLRTHHRTLRGRVERRDALLDIVRAVNTTIEPPKIAESIVDLASTWVPAPGWAVVADVAGELSVLTERGLSAELAPTVLAVATWVMTRGQEFLTADVARDARLRAALCGTVVAFPLASRGRRIGALVAVDPQSSSREPRLSPAFLRAARELLEPAAVALDGALRIKRAEALSVTDDLTGLSNSRYLNLVLRRETKRASRSGRPLSLLFIDLDGFKRINDTHGHLFGSRALVEAAGVIRSSARETDVVARFGGDEFSLVLPDTGGEGAFAVGERVRERMAAHRFLAGDGLDIHLTVSVGVATLPDAAASAEELVQAADAAMYRVKESGKNGIQAAPTSTENI
jgi:diguanylate cyclase (GGDEF)-like protein